MYLAVVSKVEVCGQGTTRGRECNGTMAQPSDGSQKCELKSGNGRGTGIRRDAANEGGRKR
jgi:hypothetical protein